MKKQLLFFGFALLLNGMQAQIVNIPDANFKSTLIGLGVDTNGDGQIQVSEAEAVTNLYMTSRNINSLEGIQAFINLIVLDCSDNNLSSLTITQLANLERLSIHKNQLTSIDLSHNLNLKSISCGDNFITELDLSLHTNLEEVLCPANRLVKLNIQNGNNANLRDLRTTSNDDLTCIQVDDVDFANSMICQGNYPRWCIGANTTFSENCDEIIINIPDANFYDALVNSNCVDTNGDGVGDDDVDTNNNGELTLAEVEAVLRLHISNKNISSLEGISYFLNLEYLDCSLNQLTSLIFPTNSELKYLWCGANQLTEIDISYCQKLVALGCSSNQLTALMLDQQPGLRFLQAQHNQLTRLDVASGNNSILQRMWAFNNPDLECIRVDNVADANAQVCDIANNTGWCKDPDTAYCLVNVYIPDSAFKNALRVHNSPVVDINGDGEIQYYEAEMVNNLYVHERGIASLQGIEAFINLRYLDCSNNVLTQLDLSQNEKLETLWCKQSQLQSLDIRKCINLEILEIWQNNLTEIDVTQNINLVELDFGSNNLTSINISQNSLLERMFCTNNNLSSIDASQNPSLSYLWCWGNNLSVLNIKNGGSPGMGSFNARWNPSLACIQVDDEEYANNQPNCGWPGYGWCIDDDISSYSENCPYPLVDIPDVNFKNALLNTLCVDLNEDGIGDVAVDTNNDGEIQEYEAKYITNLNLSGNNIASLEGIQGFPSLKILRCEENLLTSLDVSQNIALERLDCDNNNILALDVSQNPNLKILDCYSNILLNLNIANGNNTNIDRMFAFDNYNLHCIQVDDVDYANSLPNCQGATGWCISATTSYEEFCVLGVADEVLSTIAIYPNPVNEMLYVNSNEPIETLIVYSLQGVVVEKASFIKEIDVSYLAAGMYFIQLSAEGKTVTKKFIKN